MKLLSLAVLLLCAENVHAQLAVSVSPPKVTGSKAVVELGMKNDLSKEVESARAVVFLTDEQGKMAGTATRWVIGGSEDKPGLAAGATNTFHFVVTGDKPFTSTNLTAKVSFTRIVLEGGKVADVTKDVVVTTGGK